MTTISLTPRAAREQKTFRTLLNAMARPGSVGQIGRPWVETHGITEARGIAESDVWFAPLVSIAEALVDHEVTFAVTLDDGTSFIDAVLRQTGSRMASLAEADYVFCDEDSFVEAVNAAKDGPFEYPDKGATVLCLVESVSTEGYNGERLVLKGPGIKDEARVWVEGITPEALEAIEERNSEPPLGIDIVLVAPNGSFTCLTRYTTLVKEVN